MDDETRKRVDAACLQLLKRERFEWSESAYADGGGWIFRNGDGRLDVCSPSRQESLVVPLAEALMERGWRGAIAWEPGGTPLYRVLLEETNEAGELTGRDAEGGAGTIQEALALAAARAVGEK